MKENNSALEPQLLQPKRGFEYKWVIVGICFLMIMITLGFCSSTGSLYLDVVTEALNIERSLFSLNNTFRFVSNAIINLFFGALVHKFGTKKLMLAGCLSLVGAMVLYAAATNLFMFYMGGVLLGIGFSWTGTTMIGCVINKWCSESRGTIMGAVLAANGIGGAVAIQLLSPIIESGGENYRKAYLVSGLAVLAVGVVILIFMREAPRANDPSRVVHTKKKKRGSSWVGIEYSKATKTSLFYMAAVAIFLAGFCLQGIGGIAKAHMRDMGLDAAYVAYALSFHSLCLAVCKFATGVIYDKLGLRVTTTMCAMTGAVVMLLLSFVTNSPLGMAIAMIYSIFSALALPLETIMLPIYASDLFGEVSYEKILGIFVSINVTGYALSSPVTNLCYDLLGTYKPILIICSGIMVGVAVIMQFVISKAHRIRQEVEAAAD